MNKIFSYLLFFILIISFETNAQNSSYYERHIKSLTENKHYYYIKPEITFWPSKSEIQATSAQYSSYGNHTTLLYSILGGYQNDFFNIESGIKILPMKTGFSMALTANDFVFYKASSNSYFVQIPVNVKLTVWRPSSKVSLYGLVGAGYNINLDNNGVVVPGTISIKPTTTIPSGQVITFNVIKDFKSVPRFISGELGIELQWQFNSRVSSVFQLKNIFSKKDVNQLNATVNIIGDTKIDQINSRTGTNGVCVGIGLLYNLVNAL